MQDQPATRICRPLIKLCLDFDNVHILLQDPKMKSSQSLTQGSASLRAGNRTIRLFVTARVDTATSATSFRCHLEPGTALTSLEEILGAGGLWRSQTVLMTGNTSTSLSSLALDSNVITVTKEYGDFDHHQIASIFANTTTETWKKHLPTGFPKSIRAGTPSGRTF